MGHIPDFIAASSECTLEYLLGYSILLRFLFYEPMVYMVQSILLGRTENKKHFFTPDERICDVYTGRFLSHNLDSPSIKHEGTLGSHYFALVSSNFTSPFPLLSFPQSVCHIACCAPSRVLMFTANIYCSCLRPHSRPSVLPHVLALRAVHR